MSLDKIRCILLYTRYCPQAYEVSCYCTNNCLTCCSKAYYYCPALKKKYYVGKTKVLVKTEKNVLDERVVKYEEKILTQEYVDEMLSRK